MKNTSAVITLSLLMVFLVSGESLAQIELSIPDLNATPGSAVAVPVVISEGAGIAALQFVVEFDEGIVSIQDDASIIPGDLLSDHGIRQGSEPGRFRLVIFSVALSSMNSGSGSVAQLLFHTAGGLSEGTVADVSLSQARASDSEGNQVDVSLRDGTITINNEPNLPEAGENARIFPQFANGSFTGGSFFTTLVFVNLTEAPSSGEIQFFKSDGSPFVITLKDGRMGAAFDFNVPPGGITLFESDGSGDLSAGYATVSANTPLGGVLLFSILNSSGQVLTEAGVGASPVSDSFSVPVLFESEKVNTGIALANVTDEMVEVTMSLKDENGLVLATLVFNLAPREHLPEFVTELFETITSRAEFRGSIEVTASARISAIALQQSGILLTTFPVVELP